MNKTLSLPSRSFWSRKTSDVLIYCKTKGRYEASTSQSWGPGPAEEAMPNPEAKRRRTRDSRAKHRAGEAECCRQKEEGDQRPRAEKQGQWFPGIGFVWE